MNLEYTTSFDTLVNRKNTHSLKWDYPHLLEREGVTVPDDILPMWIADMDFQTAPKIIERLHDVAECGVYGYCFPPHNLNERVAEWMQTVHNWNIAPEHIIFSPTTMPAMNFFIFSHTQKGDEIIIQPPLYPPIAQNIIQHGRTLVINELQKSSNGYEIDFDHLERCITPRTKVLVFCNPQNPTGRAWNIQELERIAELCNAYNILLFSDDVHGDIVYDGYKYVPIASLSPEIAQRTVTAFTSVKAFNLPGLAIAMLIVPNQTMHDAISQCQSTYIGKTILNPFSMAALDAAYSGGKPWLDELMQYLQQNRAVALAYITEHLPQVTVLAPEATFLLWLDFSALALSGKELLSMLYQHAKVGLSYGVDFGNGGEHHMRLNFACPRSVLIEGLTRIKNAIQILHA